MLCALVVLLYLAISPLRSLVADFHLSAQLGALQREARELAQEQRLLEDPGTAQIEARSLGLVRPGEHEYVVNGLPNN